MSSRVQPKEVIERLFRELVALYGARFTRMWADVDPEVMKATWGRELGGFTMQEIGRGLEACGEHPPTVRGFKALCRPPEDIDAAFYEAARLWPSREGWSSPVVYWAAAAIGNDVRTQPYNELRGRWREAYMRAVSDPQPMPPLAQAPALKGPVVDPAARKSAGDKVLRWCREHLPGMRGAS